MPNIEWLDEEKKWRLVEDKNRYGVVSKDGKVICTVKYLRISPFVDGLAAIRFKKNIFSKIQTGVINENGEETLFSSEYLEIKVLNRNMIAAKVEVAKDKFKWCLIKKTGERICQPKYDACPEKILHTDLWRAPIDTKYAVISANAQQLSKPIYDDIWWFEGYLQGLRDRYWYKMNKQAVEIDCRPHSTHYSLNYVKSLYS